MPIDKLASLTSAVLTWTSCIMLQGYLMRIEMIVEDLTDHIIRNGLPFILTI